MSLQKNEIAPGSKMNVNLRNAEITACFQKWLSSGAYLNSSSIGDAHHLAFLAGVKCGADLVAKLAQDQKKVDESGNGTS